MKKLFFTICLFTTMVSVSKAQTTDEELDLITSILKSEVKVFFAQNIQLSTTEAETFWTTYDEYETALKPISKKRIELMKEVIKKDGVLNEEEFDKKINELNKIHKERLALRMKYYKKLKKQLGIKTAAQFYQIDGYIYTQISANFNEGLPILVPEKK